MDRTDNASTAGHRSRKNSCTRCGSDAAVRIHRTTLERIFKPWRFGWHKMECDLCRRAFWVRVKQS